MVITTEFKNNVYGNPILKTISKNGNLKQYTEISYNDASIKKEEKIFDSNNNLVTTYSYEYDDQGRVFVVTFFDHILKYEKNRWKYLYDGNGLLNKLYTYDSGDSTPVFVKEYYYKFPKKKK